MFKTQPCLVGHILFSFLFALTLFSFNILTKQRERRFEPIFSWNGAIRREDNLVLVTIFLQFRLPYLVGRWTDSFTDYWCNIFSLKYQLSNLFFSISFAQVVMYTIDFFGFSAYCVAYGASVLSGTSFTAI